MIRKLFALIVAVAFAWPVSAAEPQMRAHFIDVGQAASTLLEFPCGAILIDTGGQDDNSTINLANYLKAFFDRRPDLHNKLNALVISHPHIDHTRGIQAVLSSCRVQAYIDGGLIQGSGKAGVKYVRDHAHEHMAVIREIKDDAITALPQKTGLTDEDIDSIKCADCDPQIRVLSGSFATNPGWADRDFDNLNNHSLVVRVDFGESSFLFTGDLEEPALETLVDFYDGTRLLDVDVYLVGHHGSNNGTTQSLLDVMTPDLAVIGVGKSTFGANGGAFTTFAYGHPRRTTVDMLSRAIADQRIPAVDVQVADAARDFSTDHVTQRIYATGWDGTVVVSANLDGSMRVSTGVSEDVPLLAASRTRRNAAPRAIRTMSALAQPATGSAHPAASTGQARYRWNQPIPEKRPASGGNGKVILFDVSHGGTGGQSDWVIDGGFSDFADALVKAGYTVREYRGVDKDGDGVIRFFDDRRHDLEAQNEATIELNAIKDAAVFVMAETNRPLRKDERTALIDFVALGKGLFLIADHYNADRNLNSWDATEVFNGYNRATAHQFDLGGLYGDMRNPGDASTGWLAENFGLRFRFNAIDCLAGASDVVPPTDSEQLTKNVGPVLMAASSTLAIVDPSKAKGIVYLGQSDRAKSWPNAVEGRQSGLYFGGRNEGPLVAISKPSRGKAAFIGDSSPIEDSTPKYRNEMGGGKKNLHNGWNDPGNAATLSVNIINWLATPEEYVGFNGMNGHTRGTATPNPMTPAENDDPDDGEPWGKRAHGYDPWNTDTFSPGSFGAPLPAEGSSGGGHPAAPEGDLTVLQALHVTDGEEIVVVGIVQGEINDKFGLKLATDLGGTEFLSVQLPASFRPDFNPILKPSIRGKKIRVTGTRGNYNGLPGVKQVSAIVAVGGG